MATWNPDNVVLTNKGNEVLSKVQAGVGGLTVTRIVTGGTIIPYSQLYRCEDIPDIKQVCTILAKTTDRKGSEISVSVNNKDLEEEYALYTLGIYVTHPDFAGEILYLVAECDIEKPDLIPHPSVTIATMYYSLYMEHSNTDDITIIVNADGSLPLTGGQIDGDLTVIGKLKTSTEPVDPDDVVNKQALDLAMQGISSDSVIEQNKRLPQKFWRGTKAEYDAIENKDESVLYIVTDEQSGACPYYTKEEIDARIVGTNLLVNSRFRINQKGQESYTYPANAYPIDGWKTKNYSTEDVVKITPIADGIKIELLQEARNIAIAQSIENTRDYIGRNVVFSFCVKTDTPSETAWIQPVIKKFGHQGQFAQERAIYPADTLTCIQATGVVPDDAEWITGFIQFGGVAGDTFIVTASKLEVGSVQTLAHKTAAGTWELNDPEFDYTTELLKCQRYQLFNRLIAQYYAKQNEVYYCFIPTPVPLRVKPTIVGTPTVKKVSDNTNVDGATVTVAAGTYSNGQLLAVTGATEPVYLSGDWGLDANL